MSLMYNNAEARAFGWLPYRLPSELSCYLQCKRAIGWHTNVAIHMSPLNPAVVLSTAIDMT